MFKFKGISNVEMKVIPEEENFLGRPSFKIEQIDIDNQNGSIFNELGYQNIEVPLKLSILDDSKIDDILSWLNGNGEFEFNGRICKAYFYGEITPLRSGAIKVIDTSFIRSPFWTIKNDSFVTCDNLVENTGNVYSEPVIRLVRGDSDEVDITINNINFKYHFNNENYVDIDCETGNAFFENLYRNKFLEIGFEFPKLNPGVNNISINSGSCTIQFKRKDRFL